MHDKHLKPDALVAPKAACRVMPPRQCMAYQLPLAVPLTVPMHCSTICTCVFSMSLPPCNAGCSACALQYYCPRIGLDRCIGLILVLTTRKLIHVYTVKNACAISTPAGDQSLLLTGPMGHRTAASGSTHPVLIRGHFERQSCMPSRRRASAGCCRRTCAA